MGVVAKVGSSGVANCLFSSVYPPESCFWVLAAALALGGCFRDEVDSGVFEAHVGDADTAEQDGVSVDSNIGSDGAQGLIDGEAALDGVHQMADTAGGTDVSMSDGVQDKFDASAGAQDGGSSTDSGPDTDTFLSQEAGPSVQDAGPVACISNADCESRPPDIPRIAPSDIAGFRAHVPDQGASI